MADAAARAKVVAEAKSWLRTPYHPMGRVKGVGVDCLTFLAEVYERAGITGPVPVEFYPQDWHLHRGDERMQAGVLKYAHEVTAPGEGDIVLWRFGRALAHGAIIFEWPALVIHAVRPAGVVMDRGDNASLRFDRIGQREAHFFSPWNE